MIYLLHSEPWHIYSFRIKIKHMLVFSSSSYMLLLTFLERTFPSFVGSRWLWFTLLSCSYSLQLGPRWPVTHFNPFQNMRFTWQKIAVLSFLSMFLLYVLERRIVGRSLWLVGPRAAEEWKCWRSREQLPTPTPTLPWLCPTTSRHAHGHDEKS